MASTFSELYSDFQDSARTYTEQMNLTPLMFMRLFTRGMQKFQFITEYIQSYARISKAATQPFFTVPEDMLRPIIVRDTRGIQLLSQEFEQFELNYDVWEGGYLETPTKYNIRLEHLNEMNRDDAYTGMVPEPTRLYTIYNRALYVHPFFPMNDTAFDLWYIPDIHAISTNSPQWAAWFPMETQFDIMFRTSRVHPDFAPFEDSFVNFALGRFLRAKGSPNYRVFEKMFEEEAMQAKLLKPQLRTEGFRPYYMAPYS